MIWEELSRTRHEGLDRRIPVVLNLASIEQHGPALPVRTDTAIGWHLCLGVDKILGDEVLILPQLKVCYSQHHMDFPGSLTVSHEALLHYVCNLLESVVFQGYKNILILNSHGGNQALMQVVLEKLGNQYQQVNWAATSWWKLCTKELKSIQESGFMGNGHAAEFEFSLMEYLEKELIDYTYKSEGSRPKVQQEWAQADLLEGGAVSLMRTFREMTQDGTYGLTEKANREKGEKIYGFAVQRIVSLLRDMKSMDLRG